MDELGNGCHLPPDLSVCLFVEWVQPHFLHGVQPTVYSVTDLKKKKTEKKGTKTEKKVQKQKKKVQKQQKQNVEERKEAWRLNEAGVSGALYCLQSSTDWDIVQSREIAPIRELAPLGKKSRLILASIPLSFRGV